MQLFVSYAHSDEHRVKKLVEILQDGGHTAWFDHRLLGGQDWQAQLQNAILRADVFVYALTPNSAQSEWCRWEMAQAVGMHKPILPVMLKKTNLPPGLQAIQYIDFTKGVTANGIAKMFHSLQNATPIDPRRLPPVKHRPKGKPALAYRVSNTLWWITLGSFVLVFGIAVGLVAIFLLRDRNSTKDEEINEVTAAIEQTDEIEDDATSTLRNQRTNTPTRTPTPTPRNRPRATRTNTPFSVAPPTTAPSLTPIPPTHTPVPVLTAYDYFVMGESAYGARNYSEAIGHFQNAVNLDPYYYDAYIRLGDSYYLLGQYSDGLYAYQNAANIEPNRAEVYVHLGESYRVLNDYDLAIANFTYAISLNPNYSYAYQKLGDALYYVGENSLALEAYCNYVNTSGGNVSQELYNFITELEIYLGTNRC